MKTSKVTFLAAAAVATMGYVGFATPAANASSVVSRMDLNGVTGNDFHDINAEYLVKGAGNSQTGVIQAGDIVRGGINFESINTQNGPDQLAGIFSLYVESVTNIHTDTTTGQTVADIVFGADSTFNTWLAGFGANGPTANTGTMVRLWENPTNTVNYQDGTKTADQNIASGTNGAFFQDWGFTDQNLASHYDTVTSSIVSQNGEGWVVRDGGINFTAASGVGSTHRIGTGNFALNILGTGGQLATGDVLDHTDTITNAAIGASASAGAQVTGTSNVYGTQNTGFDPAGFPVKSTSDAYLVAVPVPATAYLGLALFGLIGVAGAWRKYRLAA